jgi:pimeloyl-ACP methyl ester carboxylesterase
VLLIPGLAVVAESFPSTLDALREDRDVYSVDPRGAGESGVGRPFLLSDIAADIVAALDVAGVADAHVVGISMGGMIAQEFAVLAPKRVRTLTLTCTTPGRRYGVPPTKRAVTQLVTSLMTAHRIKSLDEAVAKFGPVLFGDDSDPEVVRAFFADRRHSPRIRPAGVLAQMAAIQCFGVRDKLRTITAPTLAITGASDPLVPARNSEVLADLIPGARLSVLPGGHVFMHEHPERYIAEVKEHFTRRD